MSPAPTLTGTGDAQSVPAWGCECTTCARMRHSPQHYRQPCSGVVKFNDAITLIDAGLHDLTDRWSPGSFQQFLLTHYHMDHVQGLFPLCWSVGDTIPVYGPSDEQGCDNLSKHPGLLGFSHTVGPLVVFDLQESQVTPLPLNHSKLTSDYLLEAAHSRVAWLSGTVGLSEKTLKSLCNNQPRVVVIDCSHLSCEDASRNRYDLSTVLALDQIVRPSQVILTHINHQFDARLMENALPSGFGVGLDEMDIEMAWGKIPAPAPILTPILIFHSPLFIFRSSTLLIRLALVIVQLPTAALELATAIAISLTTVVTRLALPTIVARISTVSLTARVISVVDRLLNIADGVVDSIGLGRNGGQREQDE